VCSNNVLTLGRQGRHGINDCTNVAHSVLVSKIAQLFKLSSCSTFSQRSIKAFTQQRISCNEQKKVVSSRLLCIGKSLKNQGASKFAREIIDMYHLTSYVNLYLGRGGLKLKTPFMNLEIIAFSISLVLPYDAKVWLIAHLYVFIQLYDLTSKKFS
jgi:hypothetical protein